MKPITALSKAIRRIKSLFTPAELMMILDSLKGTIITNDNVGKVLLRQIENSFDCSSGRDEAELNIARDILEQKVDDLTNYECTLLQIWAYMFWHLLYERSGGMKKYIENDDWVEYFKIKGLKNEHCCKCGRNKFQAQLIMHMGNGKYHCPDCLVVLIETEQSVADENKVPTALVGIRRFKAKNSE